MTLSRFFLVAFFLSVALTVSAQKVKYKDIYVWLANKQYTEAEPFLKRYLKENDDNPNAYLYMGLIFEQNALKNDVLKEGKASMANIDSASLFLDKAFKLITEKELKRNDEYYETFKRRDFRTGEYGVRVSDIQFFIEKKQQELRERLDKVKLVNHYFILSDSLYQRSQTRYVKLTEQYPNLKSMLLRGDQATVEELEQLAERFDSCMKAFDIFRTNLQSLGKTGYNQQLELMELKELNKEGLTKTDFYSDKVTLWNYKEFADKYSKIISDEISPLRDHLISADIDINKLRTKLEQDSVSVRNDLLKLTATLQHEKLREYDANPLPALVFNAKIAELNYKSDLFDDRQLKDSADIRLLFSLAQKELKSVKVLDSLMSAVDVTKIDDQRDNYEHYINNTFNNVTILKSYLSGLQEFAQRERALKEFEAGFRKRGLQWLLVGIDSVALFTNPGLSYAYQPLAVVEEKYTAGLNFKDSVTASGYFYSITPSRKPDIAVPFPIEKNVYKHSELNKSKSFIISDPGGQIFFVIIYRESKVKEKISTTVAKIYRSDGLAWSSSHMLDAYPTKATFANGELILSAEEGINWVLDKNGKMK